MFLPVIHVRNDYQTLTNIDRARKATADGVFLIDHDTPTSENLLKVYRAVRRNHPDYWIGLNFLRESALEAVELVGSDVDGLWTDHAGFDESKPNPSAEAQRVWTYLCTRRDTKQVKCLYFGGFAFKGRRDVHDLVGGARQIASYVDIITTSGDATGFAPPLEKLRRIREATLATMQPIANASGTSIANVNSLMIFCDCFLVASSICRDGDGYNLDERKTLALAAFIHNRS